MRLIRPTRVGTCELPGIFGREPRNFPMRIIHFLAAATAVGGIAAPLSAQSAYPYQSYPVQQTYPYQQAYPGQSGYGYNQGYAQDPVSQIVNSLLGNRYNVSDRQAVSQCASAAMNQASAQYGSRYNQGYGYNQGNDPRYGQNQGY